ncbi:MAG TPA: metallophosphoesterase [Streptosporangiaceae bacterium]|nr:metallophosphoesterase [Streptosporangiaceae bacterium]
MVIAAVRHRLPGDRTLRIAAVIIVGLLGGWVGMLVGGRAETPIGPADVSMTLRPSLSGGTVVDIPPLGTLRLDTHRGPLRLDAQVARLRPEPARQLIEHPDELERLSTAIGGEVRHGVILVALRGAGVAAGCAGLAGLVLFRSWRYGLRTGAVGLGGVLAAGALAVVTFNPQSVVEPRFTGLLAGAPQLVGDAKSIVRRFDTYRAQLAQIVGNVSRLYSATSALPIYEPDPTTIRVLHVSDIHLNPVAWSVIRSVAQQFQVQLIIDSGDLTDHGSKPEEKFVSEIGKLKIPYVFVRGNHDSGAIQAAVGEEKNATVLTGNMKDVVDLRIWGSGDPRFTPDKTTRDDNVGADALLRQGQRLAAGLRNSGIGPDIVVLHDPTEAQAFNGIAPLVLAGHTHQRQTRLLSTGTRLFVQGSTGGAGLRGLEHEQPTPIEMSILYFNRGTHRLQGWDDITIGGLGQKSAEIKRSLEANPDRPLGPPPSPTPTPPPPSPPTGSASPDEGQGLGPRRPR